MLCIITARQFLSVRGGCILISEFQGGSMSVLALFSVFRISSVHKGHSVKRAVGALIWWKNLLWGKRFSVVWLRELSSRLKTNGMRPACIFSLGVTAQTKRHKHETEGVTLKHKFSLSLSHAAKKTISETT